MEADGSPRSNAGGSQHAGIPPGQQPLDQASAPSAITAGPVSEARAASAQGTREALERGHTQFQGREEDPGGEQLPDASMGEFEGPQLAADRALVPGRRSEMSLPGAETVALPVVEGIPDAEVSVEAAPLTPCDGPSTLGPALTGGAPELQDGSPGSSAILVSAQADASEPAVFGPLLPSSRMARKHAPVNLRAMDLPPPSLRPVPPLPSVGAPTTAARNMGPSSTPEAVAIMDKLIDFIKVHIRSFSGRDAAQAPVRTLRGVAHPPFHPAVPCCLHACRACV